MKKEEKRPQYVLCPRCELNYIKAKEKYCAVCKVAMGLADPNTLLPDEEEVGLEKLCPVCHVNYIGEDEEICFLCQKEKEERAAEESKSEWDALETDEEDGAPIGILPLEEDGLLDSDDEQEEEEEFVQTEGDSDFDYPEFDENESFDDDEADDEEEEDEDDDF